MLALRLFESVRPALHQIDELHALCKGMHLEPRLANLQSTLHKRGRRVSCCFAFFATLLFQNVLHVAIGAFRKVSVHNFSLVFVSRRPHRTASLPSKRGRPLSELPCQCYRPIRCFPFLCSRTSLVKRWPSPECSEKPASIAARSSSSCLGVVVATSSPRASYRPERVHTWQDRGEILRTCHVGQVHSFSPHKPRLRNLWRDNLLTVMQFSTVISSGNGLHKTCEQRSLGETMVQHTSCACHVHVDVNNFISRHSRSEQQVFERRRRRCRHSLRAPTARVAPRIEKLSFLWCGHDHIKRFCNCSLWELLLGNRFVENCVRNRCIRRRDLYGNNNLDLFVSALVKLIKINFVAQSAFSTATTTISAFNHRCSSSGSSRNFVVVH